MRQLLLVFVVLAGSVGHAKCWAAGSGEPVKIEIGYITRDYPEPVPISLLEPILTDAGLQGARLAIEDNAATGKFLGQTYHLTETLSRLTMDVASDARQLLERTHLIVANLEPADLLAVADMAEAKDAIIINVRSSDDKLRGDECRQNLFHVAPSWGMRADALAQYMAWKKWKSWFLLRGDAEKDIAYAAAMKASAKKFGSKIAEERTIKFDPGNRRSETGHQQIQTQIPMLTQSPPSHDIVFVADTEQTFGDYLQWRTSVPKPVAGTQGLVAVAWQRTFEEYGGSQLQRRFEAAAKRAMTERDYMAWLGTRVFGEASTRSKNSEIAALRAFIMSKNFQVAGFKGQGLTFRAWDRQMRQPIILTGPLTMVSMSPQDGFLHAKFLTDTLGVDEPETTCKHPG